MKSSLKEVKALEAKLQYYLAHSLTCEPEAKAVTEKYIQDTKVQLDKVTQAWNKKVARRAARKARPSELAQVVKHPSISEGDGIPANMDLDGSIIKPKLNLVQPQEIEVLTKVYNFPDDHGPATISYVDQFGTPISQASIEEVSPDSITEDENDDYVLMAGLNARGRKSLRTKVKSGYKPTSLKKASAFGLIDSGDQS